MNSDLQSELDSMLAELRPKRYLSEQQVYVWRRLGPLTVNKILALACAHEVDVKLVQAGDIKCNVQGIKGSDGSILFGQLPYFDTKQRFINKGIYRGFFKKSCILLEGVICESYSFIRAIKAHGDYFIGNVNGRGTIYDKEGEVIEVGQLKYAKFLHEAESQVVDSLS